jgi:hypothetical protein
MSDPQQKGQRESQPGAAPHYASFLLRCWPGEDGKVRVRVIGVRTGVNHCLADLDDLPALLRQMMAHGRGKVEDPNAGCEA